MTRSDGDEPLCTFDQARARAAHSYREARRLVFDVLPDGPVSRDRLNRDQQQALEDLERDLGVVRTHRQMARMRV